MYIWRSKNRRDTRHLLALGTKGWTAREEDRHREDDDEQLRCDLEKKHIDYFHNRVKLLMEEHLSTDRGRKEIELLRKAIDRYRKTQERFTLDEEKKAQLQELMYQNVQQIFQHFAIEEDANVIDVEGLHALLGHLNVKMTHKQFKSYCRELKISVDFPTVSFDDFYIRKIS
jgi:hypothetical protein